MPSAPSVEPVFGPDAGFQGLGIGLDVARGLLGPRRLPLPPMRCWRRWPRAPDTAGSPREACAPAHALDALRRAHHTRRRAPAAGPCARNRAAPPVADRDRRSARAADPVQDTLLCLYSCRPNLDTRVKTIRETWLPRLRAQGVPALVFVGDGDGQRVGDVVYLDAPDDYEGLPQKSLAMARWVLAHTGFAHLVKVDDDCLVDPDAWFGDLAHRRADYYGRALNRVRGQMDRTWHMAKSRSDRGRLELDKSPEPSRYADGGSGYALSRRAMAALAEAAASPEGRELIHLSFMEDKLVGDLLALRGIRVDNTDYRVSVLRRTRPGGPLVAHWENGFLPFAGSGIKLVHLDGHEKMAEVVAGLDDSRCRVRSRSGQRFSPCGRARAANALDLISIAAKLAQVNAAPVAVIACLRNEIAMMPRISGALPRAGGRGIFDCRQRLGRRHL